MQTFTKLERLKNHKLIDKLFSQGNWFYEYPYKVFYLSTSLSIDSSAQLLISVPKRNFKNAIKRNRVKRLTRESYRKKKFILYEHLQLTNSQCAIGLIFTGKEIPSYQFIEIKIILILHRLVKELIKQENQ